MKQENIVWQRYESEPLLALQSTPTHSNDILCQEFSQVFYVESRTNFNNSNPYLCFIKGILEVLWQNKGVVQSIKFI